MKPHTWQLLRILHTTSAATVGHFDVVVVKASMQAPNPTNDTAEIVMRTTFLLHAPEATSWSARCAMSSLPRASATWPTIMICPASTADTLITSTRYVTKKL